MNSLFIYLWCCSTVRTSNIHAQRGGSNQWVLNFFELKENDRAFEKVIEQKKTKLNNKYLYSPERDQMQLQQHDYDSLLNDPCGVEAEAIIASNSWDFTLMQTCNLKNFTTTQQWDAMKRSLSKKLHDHYKWLIDDDYIELYQATREKRDNVMTLKLTTKTNPDPTAPPEPPTADDFYQALHSNEDPSHYRSPIMALLNPRGTVHYNTIVLTTAAFLIRNIIFD